MSRPRSETFQLSSEGIRLRVQQVGDGAQALVMVHGNSCSLRAFQRQFQGKLPDRYRLVAFDLPGHGGSDRALDPEGSYTLPGYARAVAGLAAELGLAQAVWVGWSMGGHVLMEGWNELPDPRGLVLTGAPPLPVPPPMDEAFLPNPAILAAFRADVADPEMEDLVRIFVRPGGTIPDFFREDFRRTHPMAREVLGRSLAALELRDEVEVVSRMKVPLAILHGEHEQVISRAYIEGLRLPTLWRGEIQEVAGAGHAPHWEEGERFDALVAEFAEECR